MSRKCDHCGTHIRGFFTHTTPTVRHEDATGYTYRFCSEACANQWTTQREAAPRPSSRANTARQEEDRQVDQRWLSEGGALGPAT
ncbi:MAG: hypothetical protein ACM359_14115 [Bacillota bacterium]